MAEFTGIAIQTVAQGEGSNKLLLNVLKLISLHVNLLLILQTLYCILPTFVPDYCDI